MLYEGIIIHTIFNFIRFLKRSYNESAFADIIRKFSEKFKVYLTGSIIWNFIKRKDFFTKTWGKSLVFRGLEYILNLPLKLCRKVYPGIREAFLESKILKLLNLLLVRFEFIIGVFFAFIVVVPHNMWRSVYGVIIVITLVLLFFIKAILSGSQGFRIKKVDFAVFVFMLSIFMSTFTSLFPRMSVNHAIVYFTCSLIVLVIANCVKTGMRLNSLLEIFLLGISITAFYGFWQWKVVGVAVNPSITDVRLNPGLVRIYSTMGNENVYGELLVLALPFFLAVVFNSKSVVKKVVYSLLFFLSVGALLLTGSRSAWISFAVSIFVLLLFKNRKLIPIFIILGLLCIPLLPAPIYRRVMSIFNPNDKSVNTRGAIYKLASPMLKDYWYTGVGLGTETFQAIFKRYQPFGTTSFAHTHNLYLQLLLEAGIVTIVSFIWLIFRTAKKCINEIFGSYIDSYTKNILIAGLASLSGILVMGMADHVWFFNRILLIFWMVVGIIMAGLSISSQKSREMVEG